MFKLQIARVMFGSFSTVNEWTAFPLDFWFVKVETRGRLLKDRWSNLKMPVVVSQFIWVSLSWFTQSTANILMAYGFFWHLQYKVEKGGWSSNLLIVIVLFVDAAVTRKWHCRSYVCFYNWRNNCHRYLMESMPDRISVWPFVSLFVDINWIPKRFQLLTIQVGWRSPIGCWDVLKGSAGTYKSLCSCRIDIGKRAWYGYVRVYIN